MLYYYYASLLLLLEIQWKQASNGSSLKNPLERILNAEQHHTCTKNPCVEGTCNLIENGFNCTCQEGFGGTLCDGIVTFCNIFGYCNIVIIFWIFRKNDS